jgi:hypothetical protein
MFWKGRHSKDMKLGPPNTTDTDFLTYTANNLTFIVSIPTSPATYRHQNSKFQYKFSNVLNFKEFDSGNKKKKFKNKFLMVKKHVQK